LTLAAAVLSHDFLGFTDLKLRSVSHARRTGEEFLIRGTLDIVTQDLLGQFLRRLSLPLRHDYESIP
jgi:hypothetical protein